MIVDGKLNLIKMLEKLLNTVDIQRVFFNGIIDKELLSLFMKKPHEQKKNLDIRVIVPSISNKSIAIASSWLDSSEIKTNFKCRGKFILINDYLFHLSGSNRNLSYHVDDKDFVIQIKDYKTIDDLEKIFIKNWDKGINLYF